MAEIQWPTVLLGERPGSPSATSAAASAPATAPATLPTTTQSDALYRLYSQGRQAWLSRRYHEATKKLQQALASAPQSPEILNLLARVYLDAGVPAQAERYLARAVATGQPSGDNLMLLGRHFVQNNQLDRAIAVFAYALDLPVAQRDPGLRPLVRYLLATVLLRQGRDAAAAEQLRLFLEESARLARTTLYQRELAVLQQQQAVIAVQWGDALSRLDRLSEALQAYSLAARLGPELQAVPPRQAQAHLRLQQPQEAQRVALQWIRRTRGSAESLKLLDYLAASGASPNGELLNTLVSLYRELQRPASLAIRLADALPGPEGDQFLAEHLYARPEDRAALSELTARAAAGDRRRLQGVIAAVAATIDRLPAAAQRYSDLLLDSAADNPNLAAAFQTLPAQGVSAAALTYLRGQWLRRQDRMDEAARAYELSLELKPSFAPARLGLAGVLGDRQQYDQAQRVMAPLKDEPAAVGLRAQLMAKSGQLDEALGLLDELLKRQPSQTQWAMQKARLQFDAGRYNQGAATLQAALSDNPQDPELYEALFNYYMSNQGPPDAGRQGLELLTKARQFIPNAAVTRYQLALRLAAAQQYPEALVLLRQLMDEDPQDVRALALSMQVWIMQDRMDQADALLSERFESLRSRPEAQQVTLELSAMYLQKGKPQEALRWLQRLAELRLQRPEALLHLLGRTYLRLDQPEKLQRLAQRLLKDYPAARADLYYEWAMLSMLADDVPRSEQLLAKGLKLKPDDAKLNNALGYGWADRDRNLARALEMVGKALDQDPQNPAFLDSMAWVHYKMGNFLQAVELLKRAVARPGGDHALLLDHLGDALYRAGDPEQALQTWRAALRKLDPQEAKEDPELRDLPQRLGLKIQAAQAGEPVPVARSVADGLPVAEKTPLATQPVDH